MNQIELTAVIKDEPRLDHVKYGERYYTYRVTSTRLSGVEDIVNVVMSETKCKVEDVKPRRKIQITGAVRMKLGDVPRYLPYVTVREAKVVSDDTPEVNIATIDGEICRRTTLRETPNGKKICDFFLDTTNGSGNRMGTPCIAWGSLAEYIGTLKAGKKLKVKGRFNSREYQKYVLGTPEIRTAYELSVFWINESDENTGSAISLLDAKTDSFSV